MRILVAHASRMGSTAEIARRIGEQLRTAGHEVDVRSCADAPGAGSYDAVVIGSALYAGRWLPQARRYLQSQARSMARPRTWLFQSGPCGEVFDLAAVRVPRPVRRLAAAIGANLPTTFGGRLDRTRATERLSRWVATGTLAGDFRDWHLVRRWTEDIITDLAEERHVAPVETAP